jgi:RHS repeat-associated protein
MIFRPLMRWLRHTWLARVPLLFRSAMLRSSRSTKSHPERFPKIKMVLEGLEGRQAPQSILAAAAPFAVVGLLAPAPLRDDAPRLLGTTLGADEQASRYGEDSADTKALDALFARWQVPQQALFTAEVPAGDAGMVREANDSAIPLFQQQKGKVVIQDDEEGPAPGHSARRSVMLDNGNLANAGASGGGPADTHTPEVRPFLGAPDPGTSTPPALPDRNAVTAFLDQAQQSPVNRPVTASGPAAPGPQSSAVLLPPANSTPHSPATPHHHSTPLTRAQQGFTPPLAFVANVGQTDSSVSYLSSHGGITTFLTAAGGVTFEVPVAPSDPHSNSDAGSNTPSSPPLQYAFRMSLVGASPNATAVPSDPLTSHSSYFTGSGPDAWHTDLTNYGSIRYQSVYPGIDLVFQADAQGNFEYQFQAQAGADLSPIRVAWQGITSTALDAHGNLVLSTPAGPVVQTAPIAWEDHGNAKTNVGVQQVVNADGTLSFQTAAHDPSKPVVIDPSISFSTYLGGSASDGPNAIAVTPGGSSYIIGTTTSSNFPVLNGLQTSNAGASDVFVSKFSPTGSLVWSTYLGGPGNDSGNAIATDAAGDVFLAGTAGTGFPTVNPLQSFSSPGPDGFVSVINPSGDVLQYSTYVGPTATTLYGIAVDTSGAIYITGTSTSSYTTKSPFQASFGGGTYDAVVSKIDPVSSTYVYSSFLGGSGSDTGYAIAVDSQNNVFVGGTTQSSTGFPTKGGYRDTWPGGTAAGFVAEVKSDFTTLTYSTFLGGNGSDTVYGLALDLSDDAYLTGSSTSTNFPTTAGAFSTSSTGGAFSTELSSTGTLVYSGVIASATGHSVAVDGSGNAYSTGWTTGSFPVTGSAYQSSYGGSTDAYLLELNAAGSTITYATYLGGSNSDQGQSIGLDVYNNVYLSGNTSSSNFPTVNAYQSTNAGSSDAFVTSFLSRPAPPKITGISPDTGSSSSDAVTTATTITLSGTAVANATVTLYREGVGLLGTTTASAGGTFSYNYTGTVLPEGVTALYGTQTSGGLTSDPSADFLATVDLTPPSVTASVVSSTYSLGPVVNVLASDLNSLPNGTTVTLDISNGTITTTAYATGTLTDGGVAVKLPQLVSTVTYTLDARVTDRAGNQGTSASVTFNIANNPSPWTATPGVGNYLLDPTGNALELLGDASTAHPLDLSLSPGFSYGPNVPVPYTGMPTNGNAPWPDSATPPDPALVYHSYWVHNKPYVQLGIPTATNSALPTSITATLIFNSVTQTALTYNSLPAGTVPGDTLYLTLQDSTVITTSSLYPWSVQLQLTTPTTTVNETLSGNQYVVAEDNSQLGSGWTMSGVDQLVPIPGVGMLRIYGSGGARIYTGGPIYTSPPGDPGTLILSGGSYTYTLPNGQVWTFAGGTATDIPETQWQSADGTEKLVYTYGSGTTQLNSITSIDGSSTSISYNGSGLATLITEPNSRLVTLTYSLGGTDLVKIQNPDLGLHTFTYGAGTHQMTNEYYGGGLILQNSWSYSGGAVSGVAWGSGAGSFGVAPQMTVGLGALSLGPLLASTTDPDGHTTQEQLDATGRPLSTRAADGGLTSYGWSGSASDVGYITTVTDPIGRTTTFARDSYGYVTQLTFPDGNSQQLGYQSSFHALTQVTDESSNSSTYAFDGSGHLTSTTDALGNKTTQTWSSGLLQSLTDANNHTITYLYDSYRRLTVTIDALSNRTTLSYDGNGNLYTSTDALSHTTTYLNDVMGRTTVMIDALSNRTTTTYDYTGLLDTVTDPLSHKTSYIYDSRGLVVGIYYGGNSMQTATELSSYDGEGRLASSTDPDTHVTQYKMDAVGRVTQTINAAQGIATSVYDLAGQLTQALDELGRLTASGYNARGWQTQVTDPQGNTSSTGYDKVGNATTQTDALGHVTSMAYDKVNRTTLVTDTLSHTTSTAYDGVGNVTATTDPRGNQTTYAFDALNRQTAMTAAAGTSVAQTSSTAYDVVGNVTSQTDGLGHTTTFALDALNRVTQTTDALNHTTSVAFDAAGNETTSTDALGNVTTYSYDGLNRQSLVTAPLGMVHGTAYDRAGNVVQTGDSFQSATRYIFDTLNRQVAVQDAKLALTTTSYDAVGNTRLVTDSVGNVTSYVCDSLNRQTKLTDPNGNVATMAYDAASRLTSQTDRLGRTITYAYDNANRKTAETWLATGGTIVLNTQRWTYDNNGNVLTAADTVGTLTLGYDALNRLTSQTDVFGLTLTFAYDSANRRTSVQDSLVGTLTSVYDNGNRLTSRQLSGNSMQLRLDAAYDVRNELTTLTHYGTTGTTMVVGTSSQLYDALGRVTAITNYNGSGATLSYYNDSYDKNSRLTQESWSSGSSSGTHTYTYDLINQLLTADGSNYSYDLNGNRTAYYAGHGTGTIGHNNQLTSDGTYTYTYDNEGNLIQKVSTSATWTYGYDNLDHLVSLKQVTSTGTQLQVTYVYDILNNRVEEDKYKPSSGTVTLRHAYDDQGNIWADVTTTNSLLARYVYGDSANQIWARAIPAGLTNAGVAFYLTDHLGSVRDLMDSNGVIQDHIDYDGYGNATHTTIAFADSRGFASGEYDYDTKQEHFGARYYDPSTGRWTSQDPLSFGGGDSNLYRYVGNNATNRVDPSGLVPPGDPLWGWLPEDREVMKGNRLATRTDGPVGGPFRANLVIFWNGERKSGDDGMIRKDMLRAANAIQQAHDILKSVVKMRGARRLWQQRGSPHGNDGFGPYPVPSEILDRTNKDRNDMIWYSFLDKTREALRYLESPSSQIWVVVRTTPSILNPKGAATTWTPLWIAPYQIELNPKYFKDDDVHRENTMVHELGRYVLYIGDETGNYKNDITLWDAVVGWLSYNRALIEKNGP